MTRLPAGLRWRKSQRSNPNGACVEVAALGGFVYVRDTEDPAGPVLVYTAAGWRLRMTRLKGHRT